MTQKEESLLQNKDIDNWEKTIIQKLDEKFEKVPFEGNKYYISGQGTFFHLCGFVSPLYGFILEEFQSKEAIMKNDGDDIEQYPLLDYDTPEDMFKDILMEVE